MVWIAHLHIFKVGIFDVYKFFLCHVQVCYPIGGMSDSGSQLGSMGSLTMKSQLQITGKSLKDPLLYSPCPPT